MKRILLLFVFALFCTFAFSQFTVTQNMGSAVTLVNAKGGFKADSALILPSFSDTTAANRSPFIKYYAGNTIRVGDTVYIRNTTATKWINIGSGGGGASGYTITYQLSDSSYRLVRPNNTADTFLYTSESIFDTTSLSNRINLKLNISDTSSMLSKYLRKTDTASLSNRINLKVNISDTSSMLTPYLRKVDTSSLSNRINLKLNISDTTAMLNPYLRKIDTTNKWVNNITRTLGKDSIIYFIGSNRYAIKDSVGTNPAPVGYYGAFQDNTIQTAAAINTPYAMKFGVTDLSNAVSIVSDGSNLTRITIANTGIYNIQFSAQFDRTNSGTDVVDIWLRKNGVDVAGTGGKIVLAGGAIASAIIATWNYVLDVTAGDYYQLMWSTPDTHVRLLYEPAQTSPFAHPLIPSTILTVTQQSGIMAGTGITAINSLTGAAQTMVTGTDSTDFKIVSTGTTHKFNLPTASATNRGALSSANWSTFNGKIGAGDTASMLSPYLRKVDTASLSNRINLKVNISDTSSMLTPYSRKFAAAYTFNANNTNAAASQTTQTFRDSAFKAYTGTITWTAGLAPSGTANNTYHWSQIGKLVILRMNLSYSVTGTTVTAASCTLPSDCPIPELPTGFTAASSVIAVGSGTFGVSATSLSVTVTAVGTCWLRANAANNGYEIVISRASTTAAAAWVTIQYFAQ